MTAVPPADERVKAEWGVWDRAQRQWLVLPTVRHRRGTDYATEYPWAVENAMRLADAGYEVEVRRVSRRELKEMR